MQNVISLREQIYCISDGFLETKMDHIVLLNLQSC